MFVSTHGITARPTSIPAFTGLLDTYSGAAAAYSAARRLASTYTGALIRVRRSSDNTEQDIGYTAGNVLDESALTTFVGAGDGFVTTWYDQSGNAKNATQATAVNQHRIVSSGTIEKDGGKPCLNTLTRPPLSLTTTDFRNSITVAKVDTQNLINYLVGITSGSFNYGNFYNGSFGGIDGIGGFDGVNIRSLSGEDLNRHLGWLQIKSGNLYGAKDGASESNLGSFAPAPFSTYAQTNEIGGRSSSSVLFFQGKIQEVILYNSDQTSNKTGIESNINTFYSIY
jgi:hypothetical protein